MFRIPLNYHGKRFKINHNFNKGVIGCALSHVNLWKELTNDINNDFYIILEDDAVIDIEFEIKYDKLHSYMKNDFDIVFLGLHDDTIDEIKMYDDRLINSELGLYKFSEKIRYRCGGTHGYCISKNGASKLLNIIDQEGIQQPIDHFLIDQFASGTKSKLGAYKIYPHIVNAVCMGSQQLIVIFKPKWKLLCNH